MAKHYPFLVLGGGSAGYAAARTYAESGQPVAVVDGSAELGGLCILRGCMPSKTLIYSSEVLDHARHGKELGLDIPSATVDMAALRDRKRRIIGGFQSYREEQLQNEKYDLYRECGSFQDANTVVLENSGTELTFDKAIITTGSVSNYPPIPGLREVRPWTSDEVLELDFLPESVIILGAGVVGCELGQHLRRLGCEVTFVQRSPQILKQASPEGAEVLAEVFRRQGIAVCCNTKTTSVEGTMGEKVRVNYACEGEECFVEGQYLFNALGRKPATEGLNLEGLGIETNRGGSIVIDDQQRTTVPHIYAAGDVSGPHEIVHIAIMQGEVAAQHALGQSPEPVDYRAMIGGFFTDPEVARVGLYEHEARAQGLDVVAADYPFNDHGRSITMDQTDGFVKVVALRETGQVIGAECVGPQGCELIHAMAVAVTMQATVFDLLKVHWYHPTLAEIWSYPVEEIADTLRT